MRLPNDSRLDVMCVSMWGGKAGVNRLCMDEDEN